MAHHGKKVSAIIAVAFGAALCLALCACSSGTASSAASGSASASSAAASADVTFVGQWNLYQLTEGDEVTNYDTADAATKAYMDKNFVIFTDDGKVTISDDGHEITGTWETTSDTKGSISTQGYIFEMEIENGELTITNPAGDSMILHKAE